MQYVKKVLKANFGAKFYDPAMMTEAAGPAAVVTSINFMTFFLLTHSKYAQKIMESVKKVVKFVKIF